MNALPIDAAPPRITAAALRRALIAGARRVIARRENLNRINVFPVPDGDTGSNMAFTLGSVLSGALGRRTGSTGELMARVGEVAIDGARGNSGAILAQFLQGVAEGVGNRSELSLAAMAEAVRGGADACRRALSEPREGTILSVIRAFADALQQGPARDARGWFEQALARTRLALADTPRQLPVLARAGVVDAGAQGFVDLLEGIADYLAAGRLDDAPEVMESLADEEAALAHVELAEGDPAHRFCTECLVLGEGIDRDALRAEVAALDASCVVVAGSATRVRLHAHLAAPARLFEACGRFGRVEGAKADDMHAQQRTTSTAAARRVAILADSACDLPDALIEAHNIHVVPLRVNFGEQDFLDKVGLGTGDFYARMRASAVLPRTSQPPPGDFRRQMEFLLSHSPSLVYVGLSRAVSGTLQSAETAAARTDARRTRVVDSANASGGLALLALRAAELAGEGRDADAIVAELERLRPLTLTWAVARDLSHGVRGGRVPAWAKPVIQGLGLTPVVRFSPEGKLKVAGALWGTRDVPARFARHVAKRLPAGQRWRVIVGHADARADGEALLAAVDAAIAPAERWLVETGPAIGAHAGQGALVIAVQPLP